jgi:hypothetical protein
LLPKRPYLPEITRFDSLTATSKYFFRDYVIRMFCVHKVYRHTAQHNNNNKKKKKKKNSFTPLRKVGLSLGRVSQNLQLVNKFLWAPTAPNFIHNGSKIVQNKDKHSFTP